MSINPTESHTLLAVEIGTINTRAAYFDVVEGSYRMIGMGQSPTTSAAPVRNIMVGIQLAVENLQMIVGKPLMDDEGHLIVPTKSDGSGADNLVATLSLGKVLDTILVGLLPEVSLQSLENLAQTNCLRVVDRIHIMDPRQLDEIVDTIVRYRPDLILMAGGVDGGSRQFVENITGIIGLGMFLLPVANRPAVIYAGNDDLANSVQAALSHITSRISVTPNIRPALEFEDLSVAQRHLANFVVDLRKKQMPELEELKNLTGGTLLASASGRSRMVRFLSSYFGSRQGTMSIDVGASAVSLEASIEGDIYSNIFPQLGLGSATSDLLEYTTLEDIERWVPLEIPQESIRDYLYQKSLYPGYIPVSKEELAIEQAIIRQNLNLGFEWMIQRLPEEIRPKPGLIPQMGSIIVGGTPITGAASQGQKLMMLLDGIQPTGIVTLTLDQNNLLSMMGAAAEINPLLPVQALDSGALVHLATAISPVSNAEFGTPIVRVRLIRDDGTESSSEILMGDLQVLPLKSHQKAKLQLRPLQNTNVGFGSGRANEVEVVGSSMGVVIDARGRPLRLPSDPSQRRTLLQQWNKKLED